MDTSNSPDTARPAAAFVGPERELTGPRALARILRLLETLTVKSNGLTLAELNAALKSPKSSLLNLLRPLVADGYLLHSQGLYRLGPTAFRLAANIMSGWNFGKLVRPFLEELAARSGESVYIGVLDREQQVITYINTIESSKSVRYSLAIGTTRPLYCTAAGRVVLAYAEPQWREHFIGRVKLVKHTDFTVSDRRELRRKLEEIRRTRVSISVSELFVGSAAISSPVYGIDGHAIAAIAIGAPAERFTGEVERFREIILDVATRASGLPTRAANESPRHT